MKSVIKKDEEIPPITRIMRPFQEFLHAEASGGIVLLICTVLALIWANSPLGYLYFDLWHTGLTISLGGFQLAYDIHHWINDGLMAIFFFVVGLEIKRELMVGELSSAKKASLPIAAALGGMIVPAALYSVFNIGGPGESGWGIPMATDIAFVIGIMALLGSGVPLALKVFITALAIADDIGAVLVIAFFYTDQISIISLLIGGGFLLALILMNKLGVRSLLIYTILGLGLWLAFLKSGVHATVAGVLLAFTIPFKSRINSGRFLEQGKEILKEFDAAGEEKQAVTLNEARMDLVQALEKNAEEVLTPLQRFEHNLHPWVSFFIMPVFALANAGVAVGDGFGSALTNPISIGIIAGLFFGKQIGIFIFSWAAVKTGLALKPIGVSWTAIYGAGILAGIGFTMSLFIANLAFFDNVLLDIAKVGVLSASLLSGVVGFVLLKKIFKKNPLKT